MKIVSDIIKGGGTIALTIFGVVGYQNITAPNTALPEPSKAKYYAEVTTKDLDVAAKMVMSFEYDEKSKVSAYEQWKRNKANALDAGGITIMGITKDYGYRGMCHQASLLASADSVMIEDSISKLKEEYEKTISVNYVTRGFFIFPTKVFNVELADLYSKKVDSLRKDIVSIEEYPTDSGFFTLNPAKGKYFWKVIWFMVGGNYFESPKVAMTLAHNVWGSGFKIGVRRFQGVLRSLVKEPKDWKDTAQVNFYKRQMDSTNVDGVLGTKCIDFCNNKNPDIIFKRYVEIRHQAIEDDIINRPNQIVFRDGWHNGVIHVEKSAIIWDASIKRKRKETVSNITK